MLDRYMAQLKTLTGLDFIDLEIKKRFTILIYFTHLKKIHNDIIIKKGESWPRLYGTCT